MNNIAESKKRQSWIDIVKFFGMLAIVWGHTVSVGNVQQYLYSFHVPLFFFVIGLFFTSPKLSFPRFVAKKAKDLLVPYFLFAIISILIFSVLGRLAGSALNEDVSGSSLPANLLEMLTGQCRANRPLWFLPCMFSCYIICFAISRAVRDCRAFLKRIVAGVIIAVSLALCFLNETFCDIDALFFKVDAAIFMLSFVAVAYLIKPLFSKNLNPVVAALIAALLLALGGILAFRNPPIEYLISSYGNVFVFFASALFTIVGFCFLSILIARCNLKTITAPLEYVGKRTLPILLMHKFPILFFQVIFPWTKQPMKENNPYVGLLVAIISIVACLVVDAVMMKMLGALRAKREKART